MQCLGCQTDNSPQAKFCLGCGVKFAIVCPTCAAKLPGGARFCSQCRTPVGSAPRSPSPETYTPRHLADRILTSRTAIEGERKHVTVLFADVKGSMELLADRDPEEARKLLDPILERMNAPLRDEAGKVRRPALRAARVDAITRAEAARVRLNANPT